LGGLGLDLEILVFVNSAKEVMFSSLLVCLSVCRFVGLLATLRKNFRTDLREIFREGWQWASEQILMAIRIRDPNPDTDADADANPYRDTGKTCLGGGMPALSQCV